MALGQDKVYKNDDGHLFVGKLDKLYLFVSPRADGQHATQMGSQKVFLKTDKPGQYQLKLNHQGKGDQKKTRGPTYHYTVDHTAPLTKLQFIGANKVIHQQKTIFGKGLIVNLASYDGDSGVATTDFAINQDAFTPFTEEIPIKDEGTYLFSAYSTDNVGNKEVLKQEEFTIDLTPPKTTHVFKGQEGQYLSSRSRIILESKDQHAGIKEIYYRIAGKNNIEGGLYEGRPIELNTFEAAAYTLTYYATDGVDNQEAVKEVKFELDLDPPDVTVSLGGDFFKARDRDYISERTLITLDGKDEKVGLDRIVYQIGKSPAISYQGAFGIAEEHQKTALTFWAIDKLGNQSKPKTIYYYQDKQPPVTSLKIGSPQYTSDGSIYVSTATPFTLRATDRHTGVLHTRYKIITAKGQEYNQVYTEPFNLKNTGKARVSYYSSDSLNNKEQENTAKVYVDGQEPKIVVIFSSRELGKRDHEYEKVSVYPKSTSLYLAARDDLSGISEIYYKVGNLKVKKLNQPALTFHKPGPYTVTVWAKDKVGNEATKKINFLIRDKDQEDDQNEGPANAPVAH